MSRIRPRPMIHRHEPMRDPVNEADHARMMAKLKMRTGGDVSAGDPRNVARQASVAAGSCIRENTQPGLPFAPAGLSREWPGYYTAEATATAGGGEYESRMASFPPLATGTESCGDGVSALAITHSAERSGARSSAPEQSAVSMANAAASESLASTGQPWRILEWEKPVEGATAVKTKDGRPLAQNLDSFAAVKSICENDFNGIHST